MRTECHVKFSKWHGAVGTPYCDKRRSALNSDDGRGRAVSIGGCGARRYFTTEFIDSCGRVFVFACEAARLSYRAQVITDNQISNEYKRSKIQKINKYTDHLWTVTKVE